MMCMPAEDKMLKIQLPGIIDQESVFSSYAEEWDGTKRIAELICFNPACPILVNFRSS